MLDFEREDLEKLGLWLSAMQGPRDAVVEEQGQEAQGLGFIRRILDLLI